MCDHAKDCQSSSLIGRGTSQRPRSKRAPYSLPSLLFGDNQVSDLSPLSILTSLTELYLYGNQISDISPLVSNSGLAAGDTIEIQDNKLDLWEGSEDLANIRVLENRGVTVYYDEIVSFAALLSGQVYEVKGMALPLVTITLVKDGVVKFTALTDEQGNYTISVTEAGTYSVTASKEGFRPETQSIDMITQGQESTLNFKGKTGIIPNAPDIWYLLDCAALWKYPQADPEIDLDIWRLLDVAAAWKYPK